MDRPKIVDITEAPPDARHTPEHMARMSTRLAEVRAAGQEWAAPGEKIKPTPADRSAALARSNREKPRRPRTKRPRPECAGPEAVVKTCQDCGGEFRCRPRDQYKTTRCPACALERLRAWRPTKEKENG